MLVDPAFKEHGDRKLGSTSHQKQAMRSVKLGNIPEEAKYADEDQVDLIRFNQFLEYYETQEKNKQRIAQGKKPREQPHTKLRTEASYCVGGELKKIRGSLTISSNIIYFDPYPITDQASLDLLKLEGLTVSNFQSCLDFNDIVSIQKLRGMNKSNQYVDDLEIKKHYLHDYYI